MADDNNKNKERQKYLQVITQRLIIFTGSALLLLAFWLYKVYKFDQIGYDKHSYLVLMVFASGLIGGFVSIQQRLPKIKLDELEILSSSWSSITLIPINGGIFALVLMLMFIGNILEGSLFPKYSNDMTIKNVFYFKEWLVSTYPTHGADVGKLLFWSFVAGFSERFVPQIIRQTKKNHDITI